MLYTAFLFGLLGSFHCLGMCGPIAFALPLNRNSKATEILGLFIYHTGRILVYALLGFIIGLFANTLALFKMQQYFSLIFGILIILLAIFPTLYNRLTFFNKGIIPIHSKIGGFFKKKGFTSLFTIGILNGLLPCGLVYLAIAAALLSTNTVDAIIYMCFFGLGTVPMMSAIALGGNRVSQKFKIKVKRFIPFILIVLGILFILRGLNLGIPFISPKIDDVNCEVENCH